MSICTLVTTLVLFWTWSEMYFEWLECKSTPAQLIWCHWDWLVTPVSNLTPHTTLSWTQLYWYISFHLIIVITILLWPESIDGQNNFLHDISYFGNHSPGWLSLFGFTIIITCARCDHPRHNPCTMHCKLPIAMQTDECRRQYEDFSLDEHAADDNGMHCDAIFNEQYAKCSPYSKMQRALKYKFTQCKPWDYLLENASHTELLLLRRGLSHYTSIYNISQVPQPTCSSKSKWVGEPD